MKEWIVNLHPKGGGLLTKTRVFAANQGAALKIAREMNPNYRTGSVTAA
ncbi:hypothetical protein LB465_17305 [Salegentibacter sp. LM13S]|nr:hypothetical protein [Salegentibacter lacus]MBZ9632540.1 hypothetical protein [Salegentibacter lacus]